MFAGFRRGLRVRRCLSGRRFLDRVVHHSIPLAHREELFLNDGRVTGRVAGIAEAPLGVAHRLAQGEKIGEIRDYIAEGREQYGMQTFDQHLADLVRLRVASGEARPIEAVRVETEVEKVRNELEAALKGLGTGK